MHLLLLLLSLLSSSLASTVSVSLITPYSAPDILLQATEHLPPQHFFSVLDTLVSTSTHPTPLSTHSTYSTFLNLTTSLSLLTDPVALDLFKLSIAIHATAPAVQALYHYYKESVLPQTSASDPAFDPNCPVWIDWYGKQACTLDTFNHLIGNPPVRPPTNSSATPHLFAFDHIKPFATPRDENRLVAILYADISAPDFHPFHSHLSNLVDASAITYVLRYRPSVSPQKTLFLNGYGVELALKSTEYKVIDERDEPIAKASPPLSETPENAQLSAQIEDENIVHTIRPLLAEEISDLGIKATQYILGSEEPISALVRLAQDFPKHAHTIAQLTVNETTRLEIARMQRNVVGEGVNALWINGMAIDPKDVQPFALLKIMQSEYKLVSSLMNLGLSASDSVNLLTFPSQAGTDSSADTNGVLVDMVDVRDKSEGKRVVLWFNDLEKDTRYADWPDTIEEILRPSYPGQLRYLRKNLFSVLFLVDLSNLQGVKLIAEDIAMLVRRNVPIRFGLVPMVDDRLDGIATKVANIIGYISKELGRAATMQFLGELLKLHSSASSTSSEIPVSEEHLRQAFQSTFSNKPTKYAKFEVLDFETVAGGNRKDLEVATGALEFMTRVGVRGRHNDVFFINGRYFEFDDQYQRTMIQTIQKQQEYLQLQVYNGKISQNTDIYSHFLTRKEVYPIRRPRIFPSDTRPLRFTNLDLSKGIRDRTMESIYVGSAADLSTATVTVWVVADLNSEFGGKTATAALEYAQISTKARVAIIHFPSYNNDETTHDESKAAKINRVLACSLSSKEKLDRLLKTLDCSQSHDDGEDFATPEDGSKLQLKLANYISTIMSGWQPGTAVIINGRILGPFGATEVLDLEDFKVLEEFEWNQRISSIESALKAIKPWESIRDENRLSYADYLMGVCSIAGAASAAKDPQDMFASKDTVRQRAYQALNGRTHFRVGTNQNAMFEIAAIIDPLSDVAQKWAAILKSLSNLNGVQLDIYLNPVLKLSELPLKRFYRYVMDSELRFDETGEIIPPGAHFTNLPTDPLLTLGVDAISPWVVSPVESVHDLDNIRLSSLDSKYNRTGVEAVYMLENILIEGHARDMTTQGPPRGLQFVLESHSSSTSRSNMPSQNRVDTIVMANLGYLQLKANPGVWELFLREGRSKDVFDLESVGTQGWNSARMDETGTEVALRSFEGVVLYPRVRRKPGMEKEDVLSDVIGNERGASWWGRVQSTLGFSGTPKPSDLKKAQINVFSVASGHLYERFMSIMILSVLKTTKSSVKFWLIENFLSPSFKKFIPHMAAEYDFEYEFITYRWPHWLRAQTEKQRTIWGYKILFLDVLFPLDLDKVIFVDADQVVRADLQELVDFDLEGAPYGYTPFCNTRSGMDRFRFWEQGYWKGHLQGKPYHISALYVIDLRRFRQVAAGDRLRGQYQALSADPQSLANLDQDLPNNMQHQVPIKSLPIEWLWCETWCDDKSLKKAKTIDLCNNPLTKEPKLERARRLLPEWEALDNEVNALRKKVESFGKEKEAMKETETEKGEAEGKQETHDEL